MSADRPEPREDRGPPARHWLPCSTRPRPASSPRRTAASMVLPQPSDRDAGVISLTGYAVVFADTDPDWVTEQLPPGDLSGPLSASFLHALSERLGRQTHSVDMLTCADRTGRAAAADLGLTELTAERRRRAPADRPRTAPPRRRARLAGARRRGDARPRRRRPLRGRGRGRPGLPRSRSRRPARDSRPASGPGRRAAVGPDRAGNAASVRAFLAAGFRPVGAEALLGRDSTD